MPETEQSARGSVLHDMRVLIEEQARRARGKLILSPEVAEMLEWVCMRPQPQEDAPKTAAPEYLDAAGRLAALGEMDDEVRGCVKCGLSQTRIKTVFGAGNPTAELVFVGEAPGADEDRQGMPFVGRAGQLLTDIIVKGMKRRREDVYICNVLKCRPPDNRDPSPEEVFYCEPYLLRQLEIIQPKVICALGRVAAQTLLKSTTPIGRLRGRWHTYHGIPLRVTYHPAYILRCENDRARLLAEKRKVWEDVQEIMKLLDGDAPAAE